MDAMVDSREVGDFKTQMVTREVGPFEIRYAAVDIRLKNGRLLSLTKREALFLGLLLSRPEAYIPRQEIVEVGWPECKVSDSKKGRTHTIETHKWRLAQKLAEACPEMIIRSGDKRSYGIFYRPGSVGKSFQEVQDAIDQES